MRLMIATGGDETSAPFVAGLASSLARLKKYIKFSMGCLDFGFLSATRIRIEEQFDQLAKPDWPFRPHTQFDNDLQVRAFATRPFLPNYFPGFNAYAWIDADRFVQDPRAIALLAAASANGLAGVVPTIDRSYRFERQMIEGVFERFRMAFGPETAAKMMPVPYIASNVVSASAASPLWKMWQTRFQAALDRWEDPSLCDQAALNHVVYLEDLPHHKLPSLCNWCSHLALPLADMKRGALVEPNYPFEPIYIVANSFEDKASIRQVSRLDGGCLQTNLTFDSVRNAIVAARDGR